MRYHSQHLMPSHNNILSEKRLWPIYILTIPYHQAGDTISWRGRGAKLWPQIRSLTLAHKKGFSNYFVKSLGIVNDRVVLSGLFSGWIKKLQKTEFSAPMLGRCWAGHVRVDMVLKQGQTTTWNGNRWDKEELNKDSDMASKLKHLQFRPGTYMVSSP